MRAPRYRFPNEVREATRTIAWRMVQDGAITQTPEELEEWISRAPDVRATLENGGYGTEFTAADLLPLLHVFVQQEGGPPPVPDTPPRPSRPAWLVPLVLVVAVLLVAAAAMLFARSASG